VWRRLQRMLDRYIYVWCKAAATKSCHVCLITYDKEKLNGYHNSQL